MSAQLVTDGPYWPEPIVVISQSVSPHGFVTVEAFGRDTQRHYTTTLPIHRWQALQVEQTEYAFRAPAESFRLALEAERLRLAYSTDPLLAANNARVALFDFMCDT